MADNKRNLREESDYKKIQLEIAEAIERQTAGVKSYSDSQKILKKQVELYKGMMAEILALEQESENIGGKKGQQLKAQAEALRKESLQLKEINKALVNWRNSFKSIGNEAITIGKELGSQTLPTLSDMWKKSQGIDKAIRNVSASMGISNGQMGVMRNNIERASLSTERLGITTEELVGMQSAYADETGRSSILTEQSLVNMGELAKGINMSVQEMGQLTGQMEAFGFGAEKSVQLIKDVTDIAKSQGVNAGKVVKKFQQNLNLLNKLDFKGGVKGMAKMAAYSEKYKVDMEDIAAVADKVFRPEGAVEAAANLQMLGGSLSQLGDPFQLMYQARYAPEELAKSLSKAATQSAVFNKESGEWELNALEIDRMKEAANALGMDYTKLIKMAKQGAKMNAIENFIPKNATKEQREIISGLSQIGEGGKAFVQMSADPKDTKLLSELTKTDLANLEQQKMDADVLAERNLSFSEAWEGLKNQLVAMGVVFLPFIEWARNAVLSFTNLVADIPNWGKMIVAAILAGGGLLFTAAKWMYNGYMLRKGFDTAGKASDVSKLSPLSPQTNPLSKSGKPIPIAKSTGLPDKRYTPAGGGQGGQGGFMDSLSKINPAQLLALGAAIMMIAGAMWILSDAMVKIKEANVGWEQFGMIGLMMVGMMGVMIPLVWALGVSAIATAGPLIGLGVAFLGIGAGVFLAAAGMSLLVDSFTGLVGVIGTNGSSLLMAGVGFMAMSAGIWVLSSALISLSAAAAFSLLGLGMLVAVTGVMVGAAYALKEADFSSVITGINNLDMEKVNALKELAALSNNGKPIRIEFSDLKIDGDIELSGEGGGRTSTDWISDPVFISKLKDLISQRLIMDKNGGGH